MHIGSPGSLQAKLVNVMLAYTSGAQFDLINVIISHLYLKQNTIIEQSQYPIIIQGIQIMKIHIHTVIQFYIMAA